MNKVCLSFFLILGLHFLLAQRTTPIPAQEYVQRIGFGFDTDIFKNSPPLRNYNNINNILMNDLVNAGVGHLRLRSRADIFGYSTEKYNDATMNTYLDGLEVVVRDMIKSGIYPIISWINHKVEEKKSVTTIDKNNYVDWWRRVALRMKDYTYELSFNLFTELDDGPLRVPSIYNDWTKLAIDAIRGTGGLNINRVIIMGAPGKKSDSLFLIDEKITKDQVYLAAEWHLYASGPDKDGGQKNWAGTGSATDKANIDSVMDAAMTYTNKTKIPTWIGAWMPYDNLGASQNQNEVEAFSCYFATAAFRRNIPWAMNKLDNFYDTERNIWIQSEEIGRLNSKMTLNIPRILKSSICAINSFQEDKCDSDCDIQNCAESLVVKKAAEFSCQCGSCNKPCSALNTSKVCAYPFDKCLLKDGKSLCVMDVNGKGQWESCTSQNCPLVSNPKSYNGQDIVRLMNEAGKI
jgi:hypothetical protein